LTPTEPDRQATKATRTSKLGSVARAASVVFLAAGFLLNLASAWCAVRIGQMRCGPEPPQPQAGLDLLLLGPPALATVVAFLLVRRAFALRTGAAATAALVAAIVGCGLGAAAVLLATLVALSC
jgi:hypothetical protein